MGAIDNIDLAKWIDARASLALEVKGSTVHASKTDIPCKLKINCDALTVFIDRDIDLQFSESGYTPRVVFSATDGNVLLSLNLETVFASEGQYATVKRRVGGPS